MDPMVEAWLKEMMQTGTYSTVAARREDAALAQVLLESLKNTISQASAFERSLFVAALAPALLSALSNMAASNKSDEEEGSLLSKDHLSPLGRSFNGQGKPEGRATSGSTLDPNATVMALDERSTQIET